MATGSIRDLHENTAGVVARVEHGERIGITERDTVVALLVPARDRGLTSLRASAEVRPAVRHGTAALGELCRREPETDAPADWVDDRQQIPQVSSKLSRSNYRGLCSDSPPSSRNEAVASRFQNRQ
ncbi:type II toxin-antitoxin system Phd/YefM family antitoxin [Saccharomonospora halophila]|uniref:type II toxin-antitoxin system Phd/YefM family antitoxin n=1 Tax=Saccharomonospora halophila TaxID=129922 RepID=UPI0018DBD2BA|nr:hypothetical protein [Saccharomonospora halophila]